MQIIEIVFRERSGYRDMQLRPFSSDATPELIRQLDHDTRGGSDMTPAALSRVAGRIIRPQSNVRSNAIIANGWGEKRYMFIMKVLVRDSRSARSTLDISGYTDYAGAVNTMKGTKIDPDMCLYFNSVTEINSSYTDSPTRRGWVDSIVGSNHLIGPQTMPDFTRDRLSPGTMTMRPEDVFHNNPKNILQNSFNRKVEAEGDFMDMRNSFTQKGLRMSNRWNDSSTRFLHRSLRALSTANGGEVYGETAIERDTGQVLRDARSQVREKTLTSMAPFADMARDTNIMEQGFITYGELITMNPDYPWDEVKVFFERPELARDHAHDSTKWDGRDNTTIAALQIARALPTYMAFHHLAYVDFEANNNSFAGEPIILIPECTPMLGKAINAQALQSFEQRLLTELFVDMLPWDNCMFDVRVKASLGSDVMISIKLEGEDPGEFAFPVFCDSLVAPVVVDDRKCIDDMGSALSSIVDRLGSSARADDDRGSSGIITSPTNYSF